MALFIGLGTIKKNISKKSKNLILCPVQKYLVKKKRNK